jgi:hypothetical protein
MRVRAWVVLFSIAAASCASRNASFRAQDRAEFRRQDSSFVNRAVDKLLQTYTLFRSLQPMGMRPKEIVVTRGDSVWLYQALGMYVTYQLDWTPDACVPPSRAALVAWKELPSRAGIDVVALFAAGDSAGMRDTFSVKPADCNGPMVTLHHPILGVSRIIEREFRGGASPTGRGTISVSAFPQRSRPCPSSVVIWFESQRFPAECRPSWMQVSFATAIRPTRESPVSDTLIVNASVPALHIWLDCRGARKSHYFCPQLPYTYTRDASVAPSPPPRQPPDLVTVTGVIKDPEEGVPIPYSRVRFANNLVVYADSTGRFTAQLKPGRATATAECFTRRSISGQSQESFLVRPYMAELAFFLQFKDCARPLGPVQDSVFQGMYEAGIERSRFILCGNRTINVWTEFGPQAVADRDALLRRLAGREGSGPFTWKVRGSLEGPGRFGHQSAADYLLKVRSVLEIRPNRPEECFR